MESCISPFDATGFRGNRPIQTKPQSFQDNNNADANAPSVKCREHDVKGQASDV